MAKKCSQCAHYLDSDCWKTASEEKLCPLFCQRLKDRPSLCEDCRFHKLINQFGVCAVAPIDGPANTVSIGNKVVSCNTYRRKEKKDMTEQKVTIEPGKVLIKDKPDAVNHPGHYAGKVEVIEYIRDKLTPEEFVGYCCGNVLKYVSRWRKKDGVQDLKKAEVYLKWMIEGAEKQGTTEMNP